MTLPIVRLRARLRASVATLRLPSWATVLISILATAASVLNQTVFTFSTPWKTFITAALAGAAMLGVGPLVRGELRVMLHLSYPTALILAGVLSAGATGVSALDGLASGWKGAICGALVALAAAAAGPRAGPPTSPPA